MKIAFFLSIILRCIRLLHCYLLLGDLLTSLSWSNYFADGGARGVANPFRGVMRHLDEASRKPH